MILYPYSWALRPYFSSVVANRDDFKPTRRVIATSLFHYFCLTLYSSVYTPHTVGPQTAKHDVQISPEVVSILKSLGRNAILEFYTDIASRHSHTLDLRNFFLVWQQGKTVQRKKTEERAKRHLVPTNGYKWRAAFSNKHQFSNYPPQISITMKIVSSLTTHFLISISINFNLLK